MPLSRMNIASLFGGAEIEHYHQAVALVVAETFEQARAAASAIRVDYVRDKGRYDLAALAPTAPVQGSGDGKAAPKIDRVGDFEAAFAASPVTLDAVYTTPDESHAMMEPSRASPRGTATS